MFWWDWAALRKQLHRPTLQHHQSKNFTLLQKHTPLWLAESREGQRPTHINHFSCLLSDCAGAPKGQLGLEGLWESSLKPSPEFSVSQQGITGKSNVHKPQHKPAVFTPLPYLMCEAPWKCFWIEEEKKSILWIYYFYSLKKKKRKKKESNEYPKIPISVVKWSMKWCSEMKSITSKAFDGRELFKL